MAISNVAVFGGAFLTPVIVGKITVTMGWEWIFYFIAIIAGVALPFVVLFVPETAYTRADHLNTDIEGDFERSHLPSSDTEAQSSSSEENKRPEVSDEQPSAPNGDLPAAEAGQGRQDTVPAKVTFLQSLKLFNGRKTDEKFIKLLLRPFPLFFHPAVVWVCWSSAVRLWTVAPSQVCIWLTLKLLGLFNSRCHNRMDLLHWCHPGCPLPWATSVVRPT